MPHENTLKISDRDKEQFSIAERAGILDEFTADQLEEGSIYSPCCDCHYFYRFFVQLQGVCGHDFHHPIPLHGGAALLLSPMSVMDIPFAGTDGDTLLRHIALANSAKDIKSVILAAHVPCKIAYTAGVDFLELLRRSMEGKRRARFWLKREAITKVSCVLQIDNGSNGGILYRLRRQKTIKFLEEHGRPLRFG